MSDQDSDGSTSIGRPSAGGRPFTVTTLGVLLLLEALVVVGLVLWLLFELVTAVPDSFASAIALTVLTAIAAIWVGATARGTLRRERWIRGPALTWQLVQIAIAVGCFQGAFAVPALGFAILVPSLAVIGLLFTPSVVEATRRDVA